MGRKNDEQLDELREQIEGLTREVAGLRSEKEFLQNYHALAAETVTLQEEISTLKIERGKLVEDNERDKREVEHKIGLERQRQDLEHEFAEAKVEAAKRDAVLDAREEAFKLEREHLKGQIDDVKDMAGKFEGIMTQVLDRLPSVEVALNAASGAEAKTRPPVIDDGD